VNWILAIPIEVRLAGLFVLGLFLGGLANLGVYRLAWHPRAISPWSCPRPDALPRRWLDRLPIVGWFGLRREAAMHGPGFWVRPILVEAIFGIACAALYWWEVVAGGLGPIKPPGVDIAIAALPVADLHARFAAHVVLLWLMLVASLIDVDETTIPDSVTVPGTIAGLAAAAAYPWSMLPVVWRAPGCATEVGFLNLLGVTPPDAWPRSLAGFPTTGSLALGLGCWWLWCIALMPRTWYSRHGWRRAWGVCMARLRRDPATRTACLLGLLGSVATAAVWRWGSATAWIGLLSALVGMAASGGLVWMVRIVGRAALGREAMGFGDVTLMAMMGAFLGWQTCLVIFFMAPFAGAVVGLAMLIFGGGREIPYGPFLCLAASVTIVEWRHVWAAIEPSLLVLGGLAPLLVLCCIPLMGVLLILWRALLSLSRIAMSLFTS
jgi:leader peptidase (prepilin peptidase) / N-methyltransferase